MTLIVVVILLKFCLMNDSDIYSAALGYGAQMMGASMDMMMQYQSQKWKEKEAKKVRDWNLEMYEKQLADNRENWRLANEYNSPSAMLARLRDAGLNPLMAYDGGQSLVAASPASGADVNSAPAASGSMQTNFGQALAGAALIKAQIDNINADTQLKRSESGESQARTENINFDVAYKKDSRELQLGILASQYDLNKSLESLNREHRIYISRETDKLESQIRQIENEITNSKNLTDAQVKDINDRLDLFKQEFPHMIANLDSQTRKNYADAYAQTVAANIQKNLMSPEYIKILQGSAGQDLLNAIKHGRSIDIENALNAILYETTPKKGDSYYEYGRFMKFGVTPMMDVLKDAAVGGASLYLLRGAGKKMPKIGFH